jgi:AraC family transcriptional regulator
MTEKTVVRDVVRDPHRPPEGYVPLYSHDRRIPGSWKYSLRRCSVSSGPAVEEEGSLSYTFDPTDSRECRLELSFSVFGRLHTSLHQEQGTPTVDHLHFLFEPPHLALYARGSGRAMADLLCFRHAESFVRPVAVDRKMRATLETIVGNTHADEAGNIVVNAQTQILLLLSLQQLFRLPDESEVPACKFLDNEADREKIEKARDILIGHIGDPITIKALSRKVAMNECYLKKGFKVMFGITIFDFYQDQRMEHAKYLLNKRGKSVSEVSALLGYSSISHFSTAFKRHTGLKPCELLSR